MRKREAIYSTVLALSIALNAAAFASAFWVRNFNTEYAIEVYQRRQGSVVDELLTADYTNALWERVQTIEEAWPEVVEAQEVPYYYAQLQQAADLHDKVEYSDHQARLKAYVELTRSERLLLARHVSALRSEGDVLFIGPEEDVELASLLKDIAPAYEISNTQDSDYWQRKFAARSIAQVWVDRAEGQRIARELAPAWVGSPISHSVLDPVSEEFSPGNAYCKAVHIEAESKGLNRKDEWLQKYCYPYEMERYHYMYFRIYGEDDVIAEGLWRWRRRY